MHGAHGTHTAYPRAQGTSTLTGHKDAGQHSVSCSHWVKQNWESSCPAASRLGPLTRPPSHLVCPQLRSEPGVMGSLRQAPASVHGPSAESTLLSNDKHILQRKLVLSSTATQTTAAPHLLAPEGARHQHRAQGGQRDKQSSPGGRRATPGSNPAQTQELTFFPGCFSTMSLLRERSSCCGVLEHPPLGIVSPHWAFIHAAIASSSTVCFKTEDMGLRFGDPTRNPGTSSQHHTMHWCSDFSGGVPSPVRVQDRASPEAPPSGQLRQGTVYTP